jgi:tryptophan synthase alpha chain
MENKMSSKGGAEKLRSIFNDSSRKKLGVYYTAGFPKLNSTLEVALSLQEAGADFIEIGVPFSDSLVDGATIQAANMQALANGMTLQVLFEQLKELRPQVHIPVVLMGGLNPVLRYGMQNFVRDCRACGIDGVILPELPTADYVKSYQELFRSAGLANILLIAPNSSVERIREIDGISNSFIYVVSSTGTTGEKFTQSSTGVQYLRELSELNLQNPLMVGFGIRDAESFSAATSFAAGGIVGSQMLRVIEEKVESSAIHSFLSQLRPV